MLITIEMLDDHEIETIKTIAENNQLSVEEYCTNIIRGWTQDQIRGMYIYNARTAPLEDLRASLGKLSIAQAKAIKEA